MYSWVKKIRLQHFLNILYSNTCYGCSKELNSTEDHICLHCLSSLGKHDLTTSHFKYIGKVKPIHFLAISQFHKLSSIQRLLHNLKYGNKPEIGIVLGEQLANQHKIDDIDFLIPVPMHHKKFKKRGYNQAMKIAEGIKNVWSTPILNDVLLKTKHTIPQAKKSKKDRFVIDNSLFTITEPDLLVNKHILIVDDVVTTGATLESALIPLLGVEGIKISIAVIAFT